MDVPDNELLPLIYPNLNHYSFKAGLEMKIMQLSLSLMSRIAKRFDFDFVPYSNLMLKLSNVFFLFGSEDGAMKISKC